MAYRELLFALEPVMHFPRSKHRDTEDTEVHREFSDSCFFSVILCVLCISVFKKKVKVHDTL